MTRSFIRPDAVAYVAGGPDNPDIRGRVRFYQEPGSVLVVADVAGLPRDSKSGFFGFHIHEGGCLHRRGLCADGGP